MTKIPKEAVDRALNEAGSAWGMHLTAENKLNLMEAAISAALPHLAKPVDGERHEMAVDEFYKAVSLHVEGLERLPSHEEREALKSGFHAYHAALGAETVAQGPVLDDKRWMDSGFVRDIRNHARRLWNEDEFSCSWNDENKEHYIVRAAMLAAAPPAPAAVQEPVHPDDEAVDRFAIAMKAKLAEKRAQGYGGWDRPEECTIGHLSQLLRKHIDKGDAVDVGNFSMMIHQRGGSIK
jgi:hypothetical protein